MPEDLFVYGQLRRPAVLQRLLGRVPPMTAAVAESFRRRGNPDTGYLEAVPGTGADRITGLLLQGLTAEELEALDGFESVDEGLYCRARADVRIVRRPPGRTTAWIYVAGVKPDAR